MNVVIAPIYRVMNMRRRWRCEDGDGRARGPNNAAWVRRRVRAMRQGEWEGRGDEQAGHAIAILDATVRSLSSFALFFSNACCRQLSRFWHSWCSGIRCCGQRSATLGISHKARRRTVPQNSSRQWGHWPTRRKTAWLQRGSDWSWQRFLAGMMDGGRVRGGVGCCGAGRRLVDCREVVRTVRAVRGRRARRLTGQRRGSAEDVYEC